MPRFTSFVIACLLLAGCSSGPAAATAPNGSTVGPDETVAATQADDGLPTRQPSGAKVRIINAYVPLSGQPGPIDIYPAEWVLEGAKPLISVPFGTASDFFDPTVSDASGNMALSAYRSGETGNGNEVASQTETLKGGEIITMIVTTGQNLQSGGDRYGGMQVFFSDTSGGVFGQASPEPGKGVVIVSSVGIENIMAKPDAEHWYLSTGNGCTKSIGDSQDTLTGNGPGSGATYSLTPGTYSASIVSVPGSSQDFPTCTGPSIVGSVPLTVTADRSVLLFIYAAKQGDLKTMVLPLDH